MAFLKKKSQTTYSYAMLKEAFVAVTEKNIPIRRAAKLHGMPESTLRFRLQHRDGTEVKKGGPTMFTRGQEEELAEHCINMCHLGYGFSRWQVMEMAANMCDVIGRDGQKPTKQWFYGFLRRFPQLKMVKPKKREQARDVAVTNDMLRAYFDELKIILDKYDIMNKPMQIWNVDETGISLDHSPPKVLARSGTSPYVVTHGKSATTTLIAAVSAIGETIPPYIIFKGQRLSSEMKSCGIEGSAYRSSPTGWSNSVLFTDFFENHFLKHVKTRPCLLLYDGHSTHITVDVIENARENDVHLYVLPPHSSHCLQPLDVSVFSPFKCSLNSQIHKHMHSHPHSLITTSDLPGFIGLSYKSALTVSTIMSGFRKTGIFPFDPTAPVVTPPTIAKVKETGTSTRAERKDNRNVKILFQGKSNEFQKLSNERSTVPKKRSLFIPPYGCAITEDEKYEEKKKKQQTMADKENIVKKNQTVKGKTAFIVPFKNIENTDSIEAKKRKMNERTSDNERKGKGSFKNSTKNKYSCRKAKKSEEKIYSDTSDDDDDELCVICSKWQPEGLNLLTGIQFVNWGQCTACLKWVHLKFCTDIESVSADDDFLCPICSR